MNRIIAIFLGRLALMSNNNFNKDCIIYLKKSLNKDTQASYLETVFDYCEKEFKIDRVWLMFVYSEVVAEKRCKSCLKLEECIDYIMEKLMRKDLQIFTSFSKARGAKELTYINVVVESRFIDFVRKIGNGYKEIEYQDEMHTKENSFPKILEDKDVLDKITLDLQKENKITNEDILILKLLYKDEYEVKIVARILNKDTKYIYKRVENIIKKFRKRLVDFV